LINRERTARGLSALREQRQLQLAAQRWTDTMVATGQFTHGVDFASRITAAGFVWQAAGENIATGFSTPQQVVDAWMASRDHCENILDPQYTDVGTGIRDAAVRGYRTLPGTWTQDFGLPMNQSPPSGDWGPRSHCPYAAAARRSQPLTRP
jgi:uncharacterized protein YkwD